ncbi:MAG TPA: Hpt domain-containing protein [Anaerolineae bacterium]|nr:Hpt domain-containing protein [Anaerolineae bacterium]
MDERDVIDRAVLDSLLDSVGGDREFLVELLQVYFDDAPRLLASMRTALAAGSAEEFRRAAHSLKSNSASFGAMSLSRLSKGLEEMGKAGTLDGVAASLAQAEQEYARVRTALEAAAAG